MKRLHSLRHEFVEFVPERLEHGVLYVSIPYATSTHLCACGCGREVVNPLAPHGWQLAFDGRSVSLSPSIGNWSFECQSHYWIRRDRVEWSGGMRREHIEAGRASRRRDIDAATVSSKDRRRSRRWLASLRKRPQK